jgi:glycerophosphoryl diester phosphodiesterase
MFIERYRNFDGWIFLDGLTFSGRTQFDFRKYFSKVDENFRKKIIVQVFRFGDLLSLKRDNPFGGIHFSGIFGVGTNKYVRPLLIKALKACGVKSVSISDFEITGKDISEVIQDFRRNGMVVSVAGVNTLSYYKRLRKLGVNCIDSDYLTPADIQGIDR